MEEVIKQRSIQFEKPLTDSQKRTLNRIISEAKGVHRLEFNGSSNVKISYDLMDINFLKIEKIIDDINCDLTKGPWKNFKKGWIHFVEENEYTNMKSVAHNCGCCKTPRCK